MTAPQGAPREAGRLLDAEIAEKIMGWTRWENYLTGDWEGPDDVTYFAVGEDGVVVYEPNERGDVSFFFEPSRAMVDAWRVVRMMGTRGFHAKLQTPFIPGDANHAGFTQHGTSGWNGRPDYGGDADSMPLAICRAALAALPPHPTPEDPQ